MKINRLPVALLCGVALSSVAAEDGRETTLTKAEVGKVAVSNCYRQCFDAVATDDRGPVLRDGETGYGTRHASSNGIKRCMAAVRSQYVMEKCAQGCRDVEKAYDWTGTSIVRSRYRAAQTARRRFLQRSGLLPFPDTYDTFDRACADKGDDGRILYGLRAYLFWSDPDFRESQDSSSDEFGLPPRAAREVE